MASIDGVDNNDRPLNVLAALMASSNGLTKAEIISMVPGYKDNKVDEASGKMFDRDKDWLRDSGVLIAVATDEVVNRELDEDEQKNQARESAHLEDRNRYRIISQTWDWPAGFKPTPLQSRLLQLAAQTWTGSALSEEMTLAKTRLAALGDEADPDELSDIIASFRPVDPTYLDLARAIDAKQVLTFGYRKPGGEEGVRIFSPWKFINSEGEWMVQGWDHNVNASRNFLLKRIIDRKVKNAKAEYKTPSEADLKEAAVSLEAFQSTNVARIRVSPNTVAWNHFAMDSESDGIKEFTYVDYEILAQSLRRFGASIEILGPQKLIDEVKNGIRAVIEAHA